ncbi:threonine/serine exporter family protein [Agrococcus versicolor]|uniref:Threonine/serine exporter family protein n=1 Tax=Agrococcus versicolor TaxID=501482 RepID=A0ABP5MPK4_9MICO
MRADPELPHTEMLMVVDRSMALRVLDLAVRVAEAMLTVGASANDVTLACTRIAAAYGVRPLHVDVTYNSITISWQRTVDREPTTLLRVVRAPAPDHAKLQRLQAIVVDIEAGLDLDAAIAAFDAARRRAFTYRPPVVVAAQGVVTVGVCIFMGASWLLTVVAFVAAVLAAITQRGLARMRIPFFFSQVLGALVVTAAAAATAAAGELGLEPFVDMRPSLIVAAAIVLMLSGMSVVAAAQDAIDGFSLTAQGRVMEIALLTVGVAAGVLGGLHLASMAGFSVPVATAFPLGSVGQQVVGSVLIAVAVATVFGSSLRTILLSAALGALAWAGWSAGIALGLGPPVSSAIGALVTSFAGILVAHRLHVPSIAVTTAAIVPLVPGYAVFSGLLALVDADSTAGLVAGVVQLAGAAAIGLALAAGASLGLLLGAPVRDTVESVVRGRARLR